LNNGTAVGWSGTILRTSNGGSSWFSQVSGITKNLFGVSFLDLNNGLVVGEDGTILKTVDGGNNWTLHSSGITETLYDIDFKDLINATAVGRLGLILRTTDGGVNWDLRPSGTTSFLYGVSFSDINNGTAVGFNGTILRTTNGGVTFIEEEYSTQSPTEFILSQNYPNPFNPSTTISWQSPVGSHQTLKVFDVLGNEVATLINEYREAGKHSVNFDASRLSSGVYFYKIQAEDIDSYIETKKMLLLK
jgi:hypothetical protein